MNSDPLPNGARPPAPAGLPAGPPRSPPNLQAMNGEPLRRLVVITNPQGFHMRPATAFAQLAGQFQSTVTVCKGDQRINGKSPLELMFLGAEQGTELVLEVSGADAPRAIESLAELLASPSLDDVPEAEPPVPPKG